MVEAHPSGVRDHLGERWHSFNEVIDIMYRVILKAKYEGKKAEVMTFVRLYSSTEIELIKHALRDCPFAFKESKGEVSSFVNRVSGRKFGDITESPLKTYKQVEVTHEGVIN